MTVTDSFDYTLYVTVYESLTDSATGFGRLEIVPFRMVVGSGEEAVPLPRKFLEFHPEKTIF